MSSKFENVPEEIVRGWKPALDTPVTTRSYINACGDKWSLFTFRGGAEDPKNAITTRKLVRVSPRIQVYTIYLKAWLFGAATAAAAYGFYSWHSDLYNWEANHDATKQVKKQAYKEGYEEGKQYVTRGLVTPEDVHRNMSLLQWAALQRGENQRRKLEDEIRAQYPTFPHRQG
jgi:hypothetical protein